MRANKLRNLFYMQLSAAILIGAIACNKKTEDDFDIAITSSIVAVKDFHILSNAKILKNLDSVFFSIDLEHGVIFNADSLPKGTDVSKLVPSITFANSMSKAELVFFKDNRVDTTINYLKNSTDSIDFTYPVKLDVTADDGETTFTYTIKVNVHQENPDTVIWDKLAITTLPYRLSNPVSQKTVWHNSMAYCLVEENDGTYTFSTCTDLTTGFWDKQELTPGFELNVESFTASKDSFFILNNAGTLYESDDALSWTSTGQEWITVLGGYEDSVLGIRSEGNNFLHTQYPAMTGFVESVIDQDFPIFNSSPLGVFNTDWADFPIAILACGLTSVGEPTSSVWAFDGEIWATINTTALPELKNPMMARYVVYKNTQAAFAKREFDVWMIFGGTLPDDSFNRNVYISLDNGVIWTLAPEGMQLPEVIPYLEDADVIVADYPLSADLAGAWSNIETKSTRSGYIIEGTEITWECPYIYIFGGYTSDQILSTNIWRGVLNRLTFTPII